MGQKHVEGRLRVNGFQFDADEYEVSLCYLRGGTQGQSDVSSVTQERDLSLK